MRSVLLPLTLCLLAAPVSPQTTLDWAAYRSDRFGFAVTFPTSQVEAKPKQTTVVKTKDAEGKYDTYRFWGLVGDVRSSVGCVDYFNYDVDPQRELEANRDNFVGSDTTILSQRSFAFGAEGVPAMEFTFATGDMVGKALILVKNFSDRMSAYMAIILVPKTSGLADPAIDRFITSFQLIDRQFTTQDSAAPNTTNSAPAGTTTPAPSRQIPPKLDFPEPADDPFRGDGGLIRPASKFTVTVCVASSLESSWDKHDTGSKMDSFKDFAALYIRAHAMPDWEYWITEEQFRNYDPANQIDGSRFVSAVSPSSGRFDPMNPSCPNGYTAYRLPVSR